MAYAAAVLISGSAGLPLSFILLTGVPEESRRSFYPATAGFASLAVAWLFVTAIAFARARQHRYPSHRAWMIRSYALTFAAVSVRLLSPVLILLPHTGAAGAAAPLLTWPLNLLVAEWLIRRTELGGRLGAETAGLTSAASG